MAHVTKETLKKLLELGKEVLGALDHLIGSEEFNDAEYPEPNPEAVPGTCRICGCTDDCGCPGGCEWVEEDLCSRCSEIVEEFVATVRNQANNLEDVMNNVDQLVNPEDYQEGGIYGDDCIDLDEDQAYQEDLSADDAGMGPGK